MAYISVADAVARTGKGSTTIHRLCRKHENTKFVKREENKFLIDEDFLSRHYSEASNEDQSNSDTKEDQPELIDAYIEELLNEKNYYRKMLERKDEQLERQDKIISNLQERQRELHHLLHHQTQLLDNYRKTQQQESLSSSTEVAGKKEEEREASFHPANSDKPEVRQPEYKDNANKEKTKVYPMNEVRIVYTVLAAVGFLLLLAVIFADELRSLM